MTAASASRCFQTLQGPSISAMTKEKEKPVHDVRLAMTALRCYFVEPLEVVAATIPSPM